MNIKNFVLSLLPPKLEINNKLHMLAVEAASQLGTFNGSLKAIPNSNLILAPLSVNEAQASSAIEGTQATATDYFKAEIKEKDVKDDTREIINYKHSMLIGERLLKKLPFCGRLMKELHSVLVKGVRGQDKRAGEWRSGNVYIGPEGADIEDATYIPPIHTDIPTLIKNLEEYANENHLDPLIQAAVLHYQFEAIHPFFDGNGRIGRLLIPLYLEQRGILDRPILYISKYLEDNRAEYYSSLRLITEKGNWLGWIEFFLRGVIVSVKRGQQNVENLKNLYNEYQDFAKKSSLKHAQSAIDLLFQRPIQSSKSLSRGLKAGYPTIYKLIDNFLKAGILSDITPDRKRYKIYSAKEIRRVAK